MTTSTATLSAWLEVQIAADEKEAREAGAWAMTGQRWKHYSEDAYNEIQSLVLANCRRTMDTCAAHRAIVELHHEYLGVCAHCVDPGGVYQREAWPCLTLRAIASIYRERSGFREEWSL